MGGVNRVSVYPSFRKVSCEEKREGKTARTVVMGKRRACVACGKASGKKAGLKVQPGSKRQRRRFSVRSSQGGDCLDLEIRPAARKPFLL